MQNISKVLTLLIMPENNNNNSSPPDDNPFDQYYTKTDQQPESTQPPVSTPATTTPAPPNTQTPPEVPVQESIPSETEETAIPEETIIPQDMETPLQTTSSPDLAKPSNIQSVIDDAAQEQVAHPQGEENQIPQPTESSIFEESTQQTTPLGTTYPPIQERLQVPFKKIAIGLLLFIVMSTLGAIGAYFAFGESGRLLLQKLPFVPKDKSFILSQLAQSSQAITSYSYNLSASIDFESQQFGMVSGGTSQVDIEALGSVSLPSDNAEDGQYEFHGQLKTIIPPYSGELGFSMIQVPDSLFFRLDEVTGGLSSASQYLPPVDQWYVVDLAPLKTQARDLLNQLEDVTPTPQNLQSQVQATTIDYFDIEGALDTVTLVGEETIADGTKTYHLTIKPTTDILVNYIAKIVENEGVPLAENDKTELRKVLSNLQQFSIDMWADTKEYLVRKIQVVGVLTIDTSELTIALENQQAPLLNDLVQVLGEEDIKDTLSFAFNVDFTNINEPVQITQPTNAAPVDEYYQSLIESFSETIPDGSFNIQGSLEIQ